MAEKKQNDSQVQQGENQPPVGDMLVPVTATPPEMQRETSKPKKKVSRGKIIGLGIVIILVALFVGNMVRGAIGGAAPIYVQTQLAELGNVVQRLNITGTLATGEKVTVYSLVSAPLTHVNVELGSSVQAGQQLFTYDTTDLNRSYRQASASSGLSSLQTQAAKDASNESQQSVDEYQNSMNNLIEQQNIAQHIINELTPQMEALQKQIQPLQEQLELLMLDPAGHAEAIAQLQNQLAELSAQLEPLTQAYAAQQQDYAAGKAMLSQLDSIKGTAEKGIMNNNGLKQSQLSQVPAAVAFEMARDNLNIATQGVAAPMNGIVTALTASTGSMATQYSPLCVIESLDKIDVVVQLSRYDLERVQVGQSATVTTRGTEYAATVSKMDAMATQTVSASGTTSYVNATISLQNPDPSIVLGLEAWVEISTGEATRVITIPISAANTDLDGSFCFVVEKGVAVRRAITLGISSDTVVAVTEGLQEGDEVILASQNIVEGAQVSTNPADAPAANGMMDMITAG